MPPAASYQPPVTLTPAILRLVAEIGEIVGRYGALSEVRTSPRLRREDRVRTIQASLAIENNTLTLEQVTAVIEGKRVLGPPREIREVLNAFEAYEAMTGWNPSSRADLLTAHGLLMNGLAEEAGVFRSGGVGIFRGERLVHMAPPAELVAQHVENLLGWLERTDAHPLIASCVFHYELEFIHPFADGNGRMGRLWQTLILQRWRPLFAYLPVETVIRERQDAYYAALAEADERADAAPFAEFMLRALLDALAEAIRSDVNTTDQVGDQVSDQVARLLQALADGERSAAELLTALGLSHRPTLRRNYLSPAIEAGLVERVDPDSPSSPKQRYRLTDRGRRAGRTKPDSRP